MLGKGLEALLPPKDDKKTTSPGVSASHSQSTSNASSSDPVHPPIASPVEPSLASAEESGGAEGESVSVPQKNEEWVFAKQKSVHKRTSEGDAVYHIEVEKIKTNPYQPRRHFDEGAIKDLALSIRDFGFLQPLVVAKVEHETPHGITVEYELIAGERRLIAAKSLGLERVPAVIRVIDVERERLEMAIIENLQRENLNPIEMARAFTRLQDEFKFTQREVATRLGKSREVVANTVRLLDLPPYIQEAIEKGEVSESHARLLLSVDDTRVQERLFRDLVEHHLTTRELKERIKPAKPKIAVAPATLSPQLKELEQKLSAELGAPVSISQTGNSSSGSAGGKITINFYSDEELQGIIKRLGNEEEV